MFIFIAENLGTIAVAAGLAGIVAAIIVKMVQDKRKGKSIGCGCGCESCSRACSGPE